MMFALYFESWHSFKDSFFSKTITIFNLTLAPEDVVRAKIRDDFHVDFINLISFAVVIWESAKLAPSSQSSHKRLNKYPKGPLRPMGFPNMHTVFPLISAGPQISAAL